MRLFTSVTLSLTISMLSPLAAGAQTAARDERSAKQLILPAAALAGSALFDIHSTRRAFERGCVEGNTAFFGRQPSIGRLVIGKAVTSGFGFAAMLFAQKTGHRKLAKVFGYSAASAGAVAGVLNTANGCGR